jgi:hypothetical protein
MLAEVPPGFRSQGIRVELKEGRLINHIKA